MTATQILSRTALLVRQLLGSGCPSDRDIVNALGHKTVSIVADESNLRSAAGQTCVVTVAQLLMAMGCRLRLVMPDTALVGPQPPLQSSSVVAGLVDLSKQLVPGRVALASGSSSDSDLVLVLGDTAWSGRGVASWRLVGGEWWGGVQPTSEPGSRWAGANPVGAGITAAVAAVEPFKWSLRALVERERIELGTPEMLAQTNAASIHLGADAAAIDSIDLGQVDFISGGAIAMSAAHILLRVPGLRARIRIIEPDALEASNLNRYLLARRQDIRRPKTEVLSQWASPPRLSIVGTRDRFEAATLNRLGPLAEKVAVGCDDIPTRWLAQEQWPAWLGVGATAGCHTLVSSHTSATPCAQCLHRRDDEFRGEIATVSFVSYWAGLLLASRLLKAATGETVQLAHQATNLVPLRLDLKAAATTGRIRRWANCPTCASRPR